MALSSYAVCVPYYERICPPTEEALRGVERLGIPVFRRPGCSAIDLARNQFASAALLDEKEALLFVDSDMVFQPEAARYILQRPGPVVGGLYGQKDFNHRINVTFCESPGDDIRCGLDGRDYPAKAIGAGFLRIRCQVLRDLIVRLELPRCTYHGSVLWPFFQPLTVRETDGQWSYEPEDYAFCRRCNDAGIPVVLDTRVRLYHFGGYPYGWEDAVAPPTTRQEAFVMPYRSSPPCT